jgi:membrane protein required for colicin V production
MGLLTGLDLIFFVVVIISALMAYFHGLTYEFFSMLSWIGASFMTIYALDTVNPLVAEMMNSKEGWLSSTISAGAIFMASFVLFSLMAQKLSKTVSASDYKAIDSSLGVVFGLLRGLFLMGSFYLVYVWSNPGTENRGAWVERTRMIGVIRVSAKAVKSLLPQKYNKIFGEEFFSEEKDSAETAMAYEKLVKPEVKTEKQVPKETVEKPKGYKESERRELEKQILMTLDEAPEAAPQVQPEN